MPRAGRGGRGGAWEQGCAERRGSERAIMRLVRCEVEKPERCARSDKKERRQVDLSGMVGFGCTFASSNVPVCRKTAHGSIMVLLWEPCNV